MTSDGHLYDRAAIERWFRLGRRTSPLTNLELSNFACTPISPFIQAVEVFLRSRPEVASFHKKFREQEETHLSALEGLQQELQSLRERLEASLQESDTLRQQLEAQAPSVRRTKPTRRSSKRATTPAATTPAVQPEVRELLQQTVLATAGETALKESESRDDRRSAGGYKCTSSPERRKRPPRTASPTQLLEARKMVLPGPPQEWFEEAAMHASIRTPSLLTSRPRATIADRVAHSLPNKSRTDLLQSLFRALDEDHTGEVGRVQLRRFARACTFVGGGHAQWPSRFQEFEAELGPEDNSMGMGLEEFVQAATSRGVKGIERELCAVRKALTSRCIDNFHELHVPLEIHT